MVEPNDRKLNQITSNSQMDFNESFILPNSRVHYRQIAFHWEVFKNSSKTIDLKQKHKRAVLARHRNMDKEQGCHITIRPRHKTGSDRNLLT